MKKATFIKNAFIMTATALLLRTIGMFFRVYMSNKIGAEGMGLYQLIFSIYVLGSTFATSGICTAVTRLVTDELVTGTKKSVNAVLRKAIVLSVLIGVASALLIFFGADPISRYWLKDLRAVPALKVLCFSLPSMGVSSCLRGYFIARPESRLPLPRSDFRADRAYRGGGVSHRSLRRPRPDLRLRGRHAGRYPGGNRLLPVPGRRVFP